MAEKYIDSLITKEKMLNISHLNWKYFYNKLEEYYVIEYWYQDEHKEIYYDKQVPLFTYWLNFFDFNSYEDEPHFIDMYIDFSNKAFQILKETTITNIDTNLLCELYKQYIVIHPVFLDYFKIIQNIIFSVNINNEELFRIALEDWTNMYNEFVPKYSAMQEYTFYILAYSCDKQQIMKPQRAQIHLNKILSNLKKDNIYDKSIYYEDLNEDMSIAECMDILLSSEKKNNPLLPENSGFIIPTKHYSYEFYKILDYFISQNLVLSLCPNCKRRFLKKYNSKTIYCDKKYKNTHDICQSYIAKINYKKKLKENPIQSMYNIYRNRLYMRLRRGKLSPEEANLNKLKEIRDRYLQEYSFTDDKLVANKLCTEFENEIHSFYQGLEL